TYIGKTLRQVSRWLKEHGAPPPKSEEPPVVPKRSARIAAKKQIVKLDVDSDSGEDRNGVPPVSTKGHGQTETRSAIHRHINDTKHAIDWEQINRKPSSLFQALLEYYRQRLFLLLKQSNIICRQNLYESALNNVAEHGWLTGVEVIKRKTTPYAYEKLLKNIHSYQLPQQTQERKEHIKDHDTPLINMQLELISTEKSTIYTDNSEKKCK
ncbi:unnamed protein product, partial [Didymodactylos carnosus]